MINVLFLLQFYVSGHSFMEADSVHGNIEREFKRRLTPTARIHTPSAAMDVISHACSIGYEVEELSADLRQDWKAIHRQLMGTRGVPSMMQVRAISFTKVGCN